MANNRGAAGNGKALELFEIIGLAADWAERDQRECLELAACGPEREDARDNLRLVAAARKAGEVLRLSLISLADLRDFMVEFHESNMVDECGSMRKHRIEEPNCSYCAGISEAGRVLRAAERTELKARRTR